ncbi:MAG TPA: hypothetical protein VGM51_11500 [Armatimonadota bacterium]|jgi:hypothetical protein
MKLGTTLAIGALVLGTHAFAQSYGTTGNTRVPPDPPIGQPYVFATFAEDASYNIGWDRAVYGALVEDNKAGFNLEVDGHGGGAEDTVNLAWAANVPSRVVLVLDQGSLPGIWTMEAGGKIVTSPDPLVLTRNPNGRRPTKQVLVPVTVRVSGVTMSVPAGNYGATLSITMVQTDITGNDPTIPKW